MGRRPKPEYRITYTENYSYLWRGRPNTNMLIILVPKKIVDCFNPPVKTCGPPRIDDAVMSNMTVKPGQKVVFNCKVKFHKGSSPTGGDNLNRSWPLPAILVR